MVVDRPDQLPLGSFLLDASGSPGASGDQRGKIGQLTDHRDTGALWDHAGARAIQPHSVQSSVSCAQGIGIQPVADVHGLARANPESAASPTKDRPVRLGDSEFSGDQHRVEFGVQAQRSELRPLEITGRVGDRGQSQSKIAQRPQARQRIIKQPPGSPDGCRPALLAPDNLTLAEQLTPAREEVFGALPQHRLKADLSG
jgi:hypothetical protein